MFSSKPKFDSNKCKVQLKMLINRINLLTSKKANLAKAEKRKVAMLLREDKEHNARILVEAIIREDYTLEAYDLIKQYTEMLIARFGVIVTSEELKSEVADAVCAIVYSGFLMGQDIDELKALFNLFTAKYGKVFTQEVLDNKEKYINARLLKILSSTQVPDPTVLDAYLTEIAKTYGVEYIPRPVGERVMPTSATLGIALPTPGMPMPQPADEAADVTDEAVPLPAATGPDAGPSAAMPMAVPGPAAVPYAMPAMPVMPAGHVHTPMAGGLPLAGVPTPYTAMLTKAPFGVGFGLLLDADNVVTGTKPGSATAALVLEGAIGQILPGDRVLAINGKPVSAELPAKSLVADLDEGLTVPFTMLRLPSVGAAADVSDAGATTGTNAGGLAPATIINPQPAQPVGSIYPSAYPAAMPVDVPIAPIVNIPSAAPPAAPPPAAPPATPPPAEDADDLLARRLAALKR